MNKPDKLGEQSWKVTLGASSHVILDKMSSLKQKTFFNQEACMILTITCTCILSSETIKVNKYVFPLVQYMNMDL